MSGSLLAAPGAVAPLPAGGSPMRAVRAGVFAASSVALAAGAHRMGGGTRPSWGVLLPALAVLAVVGMMWARRERGGGVIAAVVLLSQAGLHALFAWASVPSGHGARATSELNRWAALLLCHHAGHPVTAAQVNAARAALGLGPIPGSTPAMHMAGGMGFGDGAPMVAVHLGAALVMAWWLRCGERAAWAAAHRVVSTASAASRRVLVLACSSVTLRAAGVVWVPRRWTFGAGLSARGPPSVLARVSTA